MPDAVAVRDGAVRPRGAFGHPVTGQADRYGSARRYRPASSRCSGSSSATAVTRCTANRCTAARVAS